MRADLKTRIQFQTEVASTNKRPDVVIWSSLSRHVIIVKLTVPWEEIMEGEYERKIDHPSRRNSGGSGQR